MIVLKRNDILKFVGSVTVIAIFAVFVSFFASKNNDSNMVDTVNLPATNKVIIIDAGHGIPDERCGKQ